LTILWSLDYEIRLPEIEGFVDVIWCAKLYIFCVFVSRFAKLCLSMAYTRGQPNFVSVVDSRDGFDLGTIRTQNEIRSEVGRQPVNIPVITESGSRYSSATYPGFRGSSGSVTVDQESLDRQPGNNVIVQQVEPASAKSYRSSVSTQLSRSGQSPSYAGSKNAYSDVVVSQNSTGSYVAATSSLPHP